MRYAQINSVPYGSTGSIMPKKHEELLRDGVDSYVFWGRGRAAENERECNFGSKPEFYTDVLMTRLDGRAGFHSKHATKRLLRRLDEIEPDVVHLHNLHGYYVNVEQLFGWLAAHKCKVVWTLHDCWPFTGHCAHYTYAGCDLWKSVQGCLGSCPQLAAYPATLTGRTVPQNYANKKCLFKSLSCEKLSFVAPCNWMKEQINASFFRNYEVEVTYNKADTSVFKPTSSSIRERLGLESKPIVLGVASPWNKRKGLNDFKQLEKMLGDKLSIVMVGLSRRQLAEVGDGIVGLPRTDSKRELAELYSAASVFFNPTHEDNYPTVNLEAEACGTPVVTYDVGGCRETIALPQSAAVSSFDEAVNRIVEIANVQRWYGQ